MSIHCSNLMTCGPAPSLSAASLEWTAVGTAPFRFFFILVCSIAMRHRSLVYSVFNDRVVFSCARCFLKSAKTHNSLDFSAVATRVIGSSGLQWRLTKH